MYNSETWILKQTQENRLRIFKMSCLRRLAGVTRKDRIRNKEVCDRVGLLQDVADRVQQRRMQHIGHVKRMDHTRYPKLALHGYVHGTRRQGRPKKKWIDMVNDNCKQRDLDIHQATEMTQRRSAWRSLVKLRMRASASPRQ